MQQEGLQKQAMFAMSMYGSEARLPVTLFSRCHQLSTAVWEASSVRARLNTTPSRTPEKQTASRLWSSTVPEHRIQRVRRSLSSPILASGYSISTEHL